MKSKFLRSAALALCAWVCAFGAVANAEDCPEGNLVPGSRLVGEGIRGHARTLADLYWAPEGTRWDSSLAVVLTNASANILMDLARARPITALLIQADADDSYIIEGSLDGAAFFQVWTVPPEKGSGLRIRGGEIDGVEVRYLRVRAAGGDGNYSISELAAMCRVPEQFSSLGDIIVAPRERLLTPRHVRAAKLAVAVLGLGLFVFGLLLQRRGRPRAYGRTRDGVLVLLGVAGVLCWWNLGAFHFGNYLHYSELFHYFLGSKYFEEMGYDRLYECTATADAEAGLEEWVEGRTYRDLRTNELVPGASLLEQSEDCKKSFTEDRWGKFELDLAWFRSRTPPVAWNQNTQDHGYNATPSWGVAGTALTRNLMASDPSVLALALIDPLLLVLMWAFCIWAFGWRAAAVASLWWGTNYPADFTWTGGGFLRQDWLLLTVVGVCLVRKKKWASGGAALAYATLLRIYPVFLVAGLTLKVLVGIWRSRSFSLERSHRRFAAGYVISLVLFVLLSTAVNPLGLRSWVGFLENSRVHISTIAINHVGLGFLLSYDNETFHHEIEGATPRHPVSMWLEHKKGVLASRRWIQLATILGFAGLLLWRVKDAEDDEALALGAGLMPFMTTFSCYYASLFLVFGMLWEYRKEWVALPLSALAVWTQCADLIFPQSYRMEERFSLISLGILLVIVLVTAMGKPPRVEPSRMSGAAG